jgi:hypothetical protein
LLVASRGSVEVAAMGWMFATGPLLWDLLATDPVMRAYATMTPLFRSSARVPPCLVTQLTQQEFVLVFNLFGRSALPRVPVILGGKRLGGHCMRVAGCNWAAFLDATIVQIANKGRWGAWAFAAAKGYDYLRADRRGIQTLTLNMVVKLAVLPGAQAFPTNHVTLEWHSAVRIAWALVGTGAIMVFLLVLVGEGLRSVVGRRPAQAPRGARDVATQVSCVRTTRVVIPVKNSSHREQEETDGPATNRSLEALLVTKAPVRNPGTSLWEGAGVVGGVAGVGMAHPAAHAVLLKKTAHPAAPPRSKGLKSTSTGQVLADGPSDMGLEMAPSAPAASSREWSEWVQAERARGLADYHARLMAARELRQQGPLQRRSRTLR